MFADPSLAKPPKNAAKLSFKEAHTTTGSYLAPVLKAAPGLKPVSVGFLAGTLDYGRLDLLTRLYVRVLFGTPAGDYRNWEAIRAWAASLRLL